ncbi:putative calmodulin-regulated spectrin-associated protein 3-like [Triplophysa rosa]|uniref:Calmodulin-regulated spectrin-associated protein 3-like n=1 Tax=Triplophysa rosa TaxID=992332 RepID=A0A9W7WYD4_TRIRA|nr:putative calmodulin-regulated spectrin-associated protein 3-like [Triplophysa rosa]
MDASATPVPEISPLDRYDSTRAKIRASVRWLLSRAHGCEESVPAGLKEALSSDGGVTPAVEQLLLSCDLYSGAFTSHPLTSIITAPPGDHSALLQVLDRYGAIPLDRQNPVSEMQLKHKPINMGAHLAVIDSLMSLSAMETVGRVKMSKEVDQFGGNASWEKSLLFWINKVNQKLRERCHVEENQKSNTCTDLQPVHPSCPQRWYWKLVPHAIAFCLKESGNKPPVSKRDRFFRVLSDVCLKETMCVADSLYNLQLIREFCVSHLKSHCCLQLEDFLYAPPTLHVNIMCFLSELLETFEVQKPDFIKPAHTLDLTDASDLLDCTSPINGNSNSGSPSFILKQSILPQSNSTSEGRGWSKKQMSRPLSAVAFSIPFPLDSDVDVVMGNPLFRSVSTDSLTAVTNPDAYTPPEDLSKLIGQAPLGELATIEEALQIIHTTRPVRNEPRLRPEGAPAGFYLHYPENDGARLSSSAPCKSGMMYRPVRGGPDSSGDKHGNVDSDTQEDLPKTSSSLANGPKSGHMTNFAECRKKALDSPGNSRPHDTGESFSPSAMMSPAGAAEAQELGARLEEKRKAIEAQKRRIEAIFTKHRQRLGKTAFLQLQKKEEEEAEDEGQSLTLEERLTQMEQQLQQEENREKEEEKKKQEEEKKMNEEQKKSNGDVVAPPKLEKQVTFSVDTKNGKEKEPPLVEYNEAVDKLSSALQTLQKDMQRLTEQQQRLMGKKTVSSPKNTPSNKTPSSNAWVIPSSPKLPATPPHLSRESTRIISPSGSPSRSSQPCDTPRSPKSTALSTSRRHRNVAPKSPKRQLTSRPTDLGFQPLTRVLTPPQNVDTLPHLRRGSPSQCQVQTCSSLRLGGPRTPQESPPQPAPAQESTPESGSSDHNTPIFTLELEAGPPSALPAELLGGGSSSGAPSECSFESDMLLSSARFKDERQESEGAVTLEDDTDLEQGTEIFSSDSMSDQTDTESRLGLDVFFKEAGLSEEEMAQKRALLLQRQQRRAQEIKSRKHSQDPEARQEHTLRTQTHTHVPQLPQKSSTDDLRSSHTQPLSQSLPTSYGPPAPSQATAPGTPLRWGAFTRAEYERRHQLKIMADLEKVLNQKPTKHSGKKQHKAHKNHELAHSPRKNRTANQKDGGSADKPVSHSDSPSKVLSSGQLANHNAGKDWENGSNASSPAPIPEYTGPKLFKEPSFKSNKFIIHNALSHCCLAGKVNEFQKNKIVEEMEKSSASHFMILLRDSNCQFRAVYTPDGQSDELHRVCGVGPRVIPSSAVGAIYKYSSDRKQFSVLPSRTLSMSVDAFTIPAHLWHAKKHGTPKKVATPK